MKNLNRLAVIVFMLCVCIAQSGLASDDNKETTYQRILRSNTIRCGYTGWDPLFFTDAKTNEKKGIFHDLMEEAGKRLDLKIVWQEEIGWGSLTEAIKMRRVDMDCSGYWLNPGRIKNAQSSLSQLYSPLYIYMRADDNREFKTADALNSSQYAIAVIDGSAESQIIAKRFAKARVVNLPELSTSADTIQNLTTKKVDFLILDIATANSYEMSNPGKIKNAFPNQPMAMFPNVLLLPAEDMALKAMMDNILLNIEYDGTLDIILKQYHAEKLFLRNPKLVTP